MTVGILENMLLIKVEENSLKIVTQLKHLQIFFYSGLDITKRVGYVALTNSTMWVALPMITCHLEF